MFGEEGRCHLVELDAIDRAGGLLLALSEVATITCLSGLRILFRSILVVCFLRLNLCEKVTYLGQLWLCRAHSASKL